MTILVNSVRETVASAPGTGNATMAGAEVGFTSFVDHTEVVNNTKVYYVAEDGLDRETGIGTWLTGGTVTRDTVISTLLGGVFDDTAPAKLDLSANTIFMSIAIAEAFSVDNAPDVLITSGAEGDILLRGGPAGWENSTPTDAGLSLIGHTHLEIDITNLQSYLLNITGEPLSDLSDATITSIAANEVLKWNGSNWINNTLAEAGILSTTAKAADSEKLDNLDSLQFLRSDTSDSFTGSILTLTNGQLAFPATANPSADVNTLDDYEEGTWTPVVSDGTNNATASIAVGHYVKIGRKVHCKAKITLTSLGSVSGAILITGLPFTSDSTANTNSAGSVGSGTNLNITATESLGIIVAPNLAEARLKIWDATTGVNNVTEAELTATLGLTFDITYYV